MVNVELKVKYSFCLRHHGQILEGIWQVLLVWQVLHHSLVEKLSQHN